MKASRLTAPWIHGIGLTVVILVAVIVFFFMIKPKNDQTATEKAAASTAETGGGSQAAIDGAKRELTKEQANTKQIKADWSVYAVKYMPELKWDKDVIRGLYFSNKVNDMPTAWGRWVTKWYDVQRPSGVERGQGVEFPIPSLASDPNSIANLTSITFPSTKEPWKVTVVCKTFDDAMAHLRRFNGMEHHGMPVVDHVTLSGHSPQLMMSYDLAMYVIPGEAPPSADPRIGGGGAAGGGGGGMGGFGGMGGGGMGGGGGMSASMGVPPGAGGAMKGGGAKSGAM